MADKIASPVGIVGSGAMGRGIAQVFAQAGARVLLLDANQEVAKGALAAINKALQTEAGKGRMSQEDADAAQQRLSVTGELADLKDCKIVIEAITEDLDAKRALLSALEKAVSDDCIVASNTSSLSITTLAASCARPARFAGMHFFNPVPRMRLVEVIRGIKTDDGTVDALEAAGHMIGKEVVRVNDTPGFLVNQVGRGYTLEAGIIVDEGVATLEQVDRVMREAAGFRMGPFELLDMVGLDVNHPATELIYEQFYQEPRYRPSTGMNMRVLAGLLGRKTQEGFFSYVQGGAGGTTGAKAAAGTGGGADGGTGGGAGAAPAPTTSAQSGAATAAAAGSGGGAGEKAAVGKDGGAGERAEPAAVWVSPAMPEESARVRALLEKLGAHAETGAQPGKDAICIVTPIGRDASSAAAAQGLDPTRTIAVDALFGLDTHRTIMATCVTSETVREAAAGLLSADGIPVTVIRDSPGFIAQRIVAMIMNIGGALAQSRAASAQDINRAVKLALAYPKGPLEFADALGPRATGELLRGLQESFHDPRYRPAIWLTRRAALGVGFCEGD